MTSVILWTVRTARVLLIGSFVLVYIAKMTELVPSFKNFGLSSSSREKSQRELKIDNLPPELLMKIFGFLRVHSKVLLVNKLFYGAGCKVADPNVCLRIDYHFHNYLEWLPSIINSCRQITQIVYVTDDWKETKLPALISIIKRFSTSIKHLTITWFNGDLTTSHLLEILSLIPNVECLVFDNIRLTGRTPLQPTKAEVSNIDVLKLQQLKILELCDVSDEFANVFNFLPAGVLKDLRLRRINLNVLDVLFKRQTNITKLKLVPSEKTDTFPDDIFDNLNMESFELKDCGITNLRTVLSKQTQLKSLKMHSVVIDDDFGDFVASQLNELQSLSMHVADAPLAATVEKIVKLKGVKDVSLQFGPNTLHLDFVDVDLDEDLIIDLAESLPKLKVLTIYRPCAPFAFFAVMRYFNFVEILKIQSVIPLFSLISTEYLNPNLRELSVNFLPIDYPGSTETSCLVKLFDVYPNLEQLRLGGIPITTSLIRGIMDKFTKLETIRIKLKDAEDGLTLTRESCEELRKVRGEVVQLLVDFDIFNFTNETRKQVRSILGDNLSRMVFTPVW